MLHVCTIFGTRPDTIKMAPLVRALAEAPDVRQTIVVTGQHRQMLDPLLALFGIVPDHDLALMQPNQTLPELTARVVRASTELLERVRPDLVLVQGDTTTAFAAALAAYYAQIAVGHVEAGLRTGDKYAPFPEELNRALTARIADLHFAPTAEARANLLAEGVPAAGIEVTGNTVIDALLWVLGQIEARLARGELTLGALYATAGERTMAAIERVARGQRRLILVTGHRRESFGEGFQRICVALAELARRHADCELVYPVHLNPNVQAPVFAALGALPNVHLTAPLDYVPFVYLMKLATLVITDSGGIQEEAPALGKPVLVMRDTTERPEGVAAGTVALVGTNVEAIVGRTSALLEDDARYQAMARAVNPYGDGQATPRIVARLRRYDAERARR